MILIYKVLLETTVCFLWTCYGVHCVCFYGSDGFFYAEVGFGALLAILPDAVLDSCTIMMFGTIVVNGLRMMSDCGYTQRNITIAALSLSMGIGFTQVLEIFEIFPQIVQNVFVQNSIVVVFLVAVILNLALPDNMENNAKSTKA